MRFQIHADHSLCGAVSSVAESLTTRSLAAAPLTVFGMTRGMPASSGARLSGDDFQHAFTWLMAMRCLVAGTDVKSVGFEVRGAGNVDDVVVNFSDRAPRYHQIKFSTDHRDPLTATWFTTPSRRGGPSPLARFRDSFVRLGGPESPPEMILYTNRAIPSDDPLLKYVSGADDRLVPRALSGGRPTADALDAWASHLQMERDDLLQMLEGLRIRAGEQSLRDLRERCQEVMAMLGLQSDDAAMMVAIGAVRTLIQEGRQDLDGDAIRMLIASFGLQRAPARATLLIQALARVPWSDSVTAVVDWVDLFVGDEPSLRRRVAVPEDWEGRLRPDLRDAVAQIRDRGYTRVLVTGAFRLSTATLVGAEMPRVSGFDLARRQGPEKEWTTDGDVAPTALAIRTREIGNGTGIAVALAISLDPTDDVEQFCRERLPDVGQITTLSPSGGCGAHAVPGPEAARGMVECLIPELRSIGRQAPILHLFQAAPGALSMMLGHSWNRMPQTQLYDDLNSADGYVPTFLLRN